MCGLPCDTVALLIVRGGVTVQAYSLFASDFASFVVNYRKRTAGHPLPLMNVLQAPYDFALGCAALLSLCRASDTGTAQHEPRSRRQSEEVERRQMAHSAEVLKRVNGLRVHVIEAPGKKQHFERAIADFCRVVDDDEDWGSALKRSDFSVTAIVCCS